MDHSCGHRQHTPAPPQPTPTPQRRRLERGGPPHPPRPIPPPPRPTPPRPRTPGPPSSSPDARRVGRHGIRGDSSQPPNHLPPVQHRPRPTEGNTLPTQRTPLPGTPPPSRTTEAPRGLGVFSGRPPGRPRRGHRHTDGPHGPGNLRQRAQDEPPRGTLLARQLPVAPTGTGGFTRPQHPPGQEEQDRSGGPPARPPAGGDTPTRARFQPHRTTPSPDPRGTPTTPPPPAPTTTTVPQHPNPAAQSATTAHTRPYHDRTTIRAEPGDMAPPTPPPRPRPSQPLPPKAPMLQRSPPATSPPRPSTTRPQELKWYGVPHPYPLHSLWRSSPGWVRNFPVDVTAS